MIFVVIIFCREFIWFEFCAMLPIRFITPMNMHLKKESVCL